MHALSADKLEAAAKGGRAIIVNAMESGGGFAASLLLLLGKTQAVAIEPPVARLS